jgi:glutathione S-transferase
MTRGSVFHIARASDWEDAQATGEYRVSTLGRTLEEEGFIHCSSDGVQGATVLHNYYARRDDGHPTWPDPEAGL